MRWALAALLLVCSSAACTSSDAPVESPTPPPRPTPSGPTPSLPLAKPVASPSPSAVAASDQPIAAAQSFALQSSAFADGGSLPADYTCDGAGMSPPLQWSGAPPGTLAYALVMQDADVKVDNAPLTQWLLYNMPRTVTQLSAGTPARPLLSNGSQQGLNGNQSIGYLSPCPKRGDPPHHITFELFAQDGYVTLETGAAFAAVNDALNGHTIGQTQLTVTSSR